jgi:hypothetical protein
LTVFGFLAKSVPFVCVEFLHGLLVAFVWLWEAGFVWAAQENVQ